MKSIIITLALLGSGNAFADGFAPWDARDVAPDRNAVSGTAARHAGFAPWENRDVEKEVVDVDAIASEVPGSGFRPWS